jgi:3-hydroxybutyryl-CoA dehydrogenase
MNGIERVGVVGCGLMGSGIAEVCATSGLDVVVREIERCCLRARADRLSLRSTGGSRPAS